jgi:thermitase
MVSASAVAATVAPVAGAAPHRNPEAGQARSAPGQAIVRYELGTADAERSKAREGAGVRVQRSLAIARAELVTFEGPVRAAVARLKRQPRVAYAQPDYRYRATAADSFLQQQWGLGAGPGVDVAPAWNRTRGAGETIAVLDTGVDLTHPDLAGNLVPGWDFVSNDPNPDDYHFHGTHVAGIAAAVADNGLGIAGVAPASKLMPVRVLDGDGLGFTSDIAPAIQWAADQGVGVINMSLGGPPNAHDPLLVDAVAHADTEDTVVAVAAGNESEDNDVESNMPCSIDAANMICVAALRSDGGLAGYSNFGDMTVDVGAPGSGILSAKTDWASGSPPFTSESFESSLSAWATSSWERVLSSNGTYAATDSPDGNYPSNSYSPLVKASPVSLAGQRGCRIHFDGSHDIAPGADAQDELDYFFAGADTGTPSIWDGAGFFGSTGEDLEQIEVSISDLDGRTDVKPTFEVAANEDGTQADGAYVDNVELFCRDQTYANAVLSDRDDFALPTTGSYMSIDGTSMATPHVAGVAALVRAADPGATDNQVVEAIKTGAKPQPSLAMKTVTGGRVDALGAIDAALGQPNPPPPPAPATTTTGSTAATPIQSTATRPGPAGFATRFRVGRLGWLRIRIVGDPRVRGTFTLRAGARRTVILKASFRTSPRGTAVVRERLNRAGRRLLRRNRGRLRARVRVVLTNAAGLRSVTTQNPVVLAMRR